MRPSTKTMTLGYFGLASPAFPSAIVVPPVLLPAGRWWHLPLTPPVSTAFLWPPSLSSTAAHLSVPGCFFRLYHFSPFPRPSTALLHVPHSRGEPALPSLAAHKHRKGRGVTSTESPHGPFCSCSPPQPSLHQQEDPGQGWEEPKNRSPLPSSSIACPAPPVLHQPVHSTEKPKRQVSPRLMFAFRY